MEVSCIEISDPKDDKKYKDVLIYYHKQNKARGEYQMKINMPEAPTFKAKASRQKQNNGYLVQAEVTATPAWTYKFSYQVKSQDDKRAMFKSSTCCHCG